MAYTTPKDLDGYIPHLPKADTKFRQQLGNDLLTFLADPTNELICQDIGLLVDGLIPWMQSSNYKVSSNGIDIMTYLVDRLGHDFRPYMQTVLPNVIDRLGDAKDTVREKSQLLILKVLERGVVSPQSLLERLQPGFSHKNAKIREEVLRCLVNIINEHGAQSLTLNRFITDIAKLLSDPTAAVRDTAVSTMVDLYKHVGDRLRHDLLKRNLVPPAKMMALNARFEEVKNAGELLLTAARSLEDNMDEVDRMQKPTIPVKKPNLGGGVKARTVNTLSTTPASVVSRVGSFRRIATPSGAAGSLDEETFLRAFHDVPILRIFSIREVNDHLKSIAEIIADTSKDWSKRVEALKKIRSLVIAEATNFDEFLANLRQLDIPMQATLKDLRSQVVREACISTAFLAQTLGIKFDRSVELLLPVLINLIQNAAKIMSTSGIVSVKFVIQNIHSHRLIPIIASNAVSSKSKDIRRSCCEFLDYILNNWPVHALEKHVSTLQDTIKKGVADADSEARVSSRKAFRGFRQHFPDQAESLLQSLDPIYRKALQGEGMSASSSNNNLASGFKSSRVVGRVQGTDSARKGFRSNSAIDLQAAQRAKARAQYAALSRNKITSGTASLPRSRKVSDTVTPATPERLGRSKSRNSQSQPTSRSGSPSSRIAYLYRGTDHDSPRPRRLSSGTSRSTAGSRPGSREASRETSPSRGTLGRFRARGNDRPPLSPASRPVLAQKILQQSREAENALADAFVDGDHYRSPRRSTRSMENHSDESETSSVCSERSFDSYRRQSDSYSWSGSQQRLAGREMWEPCRDINEILRMCASTTWQERKDGLLSLQHYLTNENTLSPGELKYLCEIFTKMFMDSHTKGISVFLDTLHEVIHVHKNDLHNWTYVLLQRVFLKIGTEILHSLQSKLLSTLEVIRNNFPTSLLISNVYRFLVDATQTPNSKVKIVVLQFLTTLFNREDGGQAVAAPPASQALHKIIGLTQDMKSSELRIAARNCVAAMWNCNTSQVAIMFGELPKELQDLARNIVQSHMRKNSTGSEPGSPMVASSPHTLSPGTPPQKTSDGLDQEEIYRSLRKTTAEIQNYSYETLGNKLDRDRDTTSQDSGISQMSVGNETVKNDVQSIEEKMEDLTLRPFSARPGGHRSLPALVNGITDVASNGYRSLGEVTDADVLRMVFESSAPQSTSPMNEKRAILQQLCEFIKQGQVDAVANNFKKLLRILIDKLGEEDFQTRVVALEILAAIFQCDALRENSKQFVELLTLRVLNAHCDEKYEVSKAAEQTAAAMCIYPVSTIANVLAPIIQTGDYPTVLGAIKMLTKLVETRSQEITDEHLNVIMPGLISTSEHVESPVRKSVVFCLVAVHLAMGEEKLAPYIKQLTYSKQKLLKLYLSKRNKPSKSTSADEKTKSETAS